MLQPSKTVTATYSDQNYPYQDWNFIKISSLSSRGVITGLVGGGVGAGGGGRSKRFIIMDLHLCSLYVGYCTVCLVVAV